MIEETAVPPEKQNILGSFEIPKKPKTETDSKPEEIIDEIPFG